MKQYWALILLLILQSCVPLINESDNGCDFYIWRNRGGAVSALQIFASDLIYILQQNHDCIYILQQTDIFCVGNLHIIKDFLYQFNLVTYIFLTSGKAQGGESASVLQIIASCSQTSYLINNFAAKLPNLHLRNTIHLLGR